MKLRNLEASAYRIALAVLAGLLVLGNFGRIALTNKIAIYIQDDLLLCMGLWVVANGKETVVMLKQQKWIKPFLIFLGMIGISLVVASIEGGSNLLIGHAYAARYLLYFSFYCYLGLGLQRKYVSREQVIWGAIGICSAVGLLGLLQYIFLPDVRFLYLLGYDDHYYRLISTYFDPPFTAQIICIGLFAIIALTNKTKRILILWVLLFVALLLTYSRAEYLAFLAGIVAIMVQSGKKSILIIGGLFVMGIFLLPRPASEGARLERTQSIVSRATVLMHSIQALDARTLLIGQGWYMSTAGRSASTAVTESHSSSSDNSYFHVLQSVGVFGLVAFLWFIWEIVWEFRRDTLVLPIVISILVGSLSNNIFFYPAIMLFFWAILLVPQSKKLDSAHQVSAVS